MNSFYKSVLKNVVGYSVGLIIIYIVTSLLFGKGITWGRFVSALLFVVPLNLIFILFFHYLENKKKH